MVSVIIPTYNRAGTIVRAIDSVNNQTYKDVEIIVVDDCSDDNTEERIKACSYENLKYIRLDARSGACIARNTGIDVANGDYVAFLDSDDTWRKGKLEKQLECLKKYDADICLCRIERHDYPIEYEKIIPLYKEGIVGKEILQGQGITDTIMILAKRQVVNDIKFDNELFMWQDYDWMVRASLKYRVVLCYEILADSYYMITQTITTFDNKKLLRINKVLYDKYSGNKEFIFATEKLLNGIVYNSLKLHLNCKRESRELYELTKKKKDLYKYLMNIAGLLYVFYLIRNKKKI
ncbi:glycosyltransferase family 2 protein [Butyrivibrio sp. XPD2002]|uniref:glycosyltransferase family 2 protein n=1 Tax=Butyrivibrio sp. XPD2002 TaxID=1280665 RepID=UPI0003FA8B16|nr:glycosyltransferase family 2 protein [Butyrivibrio sp. XPD2002]